MEMLLELSTWITAAISALIMGGLKWLLRVKDQSVQALIDKFQQADIAIVKFIKPFQPVVVAIISAILLSIQGEMATGAGVPSAEIIAEAPVVTVIAIIMRELWVRFVKPILPRKS